MNVEIGAEAAQFPEKEYISGIAVAVKSNALGPINIPGRVLDPGVSCFLGSH